jgi:hypothetical protein
MTTTTLPDAGISAAIKVPMRAYLAGLHDGWRHEVRAVLDPARAESAGTWRRWGAVEYLQGGFRRRFERERRAVYSLHDRLTADQAGHLWAGGELMSQLLDTLRLRVGLCQSNAAFASTALTIANTLEYWCRQVEDALGPIRWGDVPAESRVLFETITYDEVLLGG